MTRRITVRSGSVPRKVVPPASVASAAGADTDAIHDNVDGEISAIAAKGSPDDDDFLLIEDAADSDAKKRITIGDLPSGGDGGINTLYETNAAVAVAPSGSALAVKGNFVRPRENLKIHALTYFGTILSGATYRAYVITYSGTTITAVTGAGDLVVAGANDVGSASTSSSPTIRLPFPTPINLTADTQYLIAVGRTDGGDTYGLPVQYPTNTLGGYSFSKYLPLGSGRIAKQAPAGGDTIDVLTSAIVRMGVEYEWA